MNSESNDFPNTHEDFEMIDYHDVLSVTSEDEIENAPHILHEVKHGVKSRQKIRMIPIMLGVSAVAGIILFTNKKN